MLVDRAKIYVLGGKGGNGCQSLYKDLYNRRGTPDGGDGGDGGSVVIVSDTNLQTLLDFRYNQHYKAAKGKHGSSNNKYGRSGADRVMKVPVGTIIRDVDTDLIVRDLKEPGESVIVARGGSGGKGNRKLEIATEGEEGETRTLLLELKLVADVGIIGLPNAGKSTLICRISKSHSKVANYPFTTRSPQLGVVKYHDTSFVVADMPGLIKGAHEGRGLGDQFLRHIERTSVLVHVVDMVPGEGEDPVENYKTLEKELELYSQSVYAKPRVIVANKMDMPGARESLERFVSEASEKVWSISALRGDGLKELIDHIYTRIEDVKEEAEKSCCQGWDESPDG